jgi:hypothetical protein
VALFEQAGSIINDAAVELGLAPLANNGGAAQSSTDPNFMLLWRLLKRVGRQLALEHDWVQLRKEHSFTTDGVESEYDLPEDFSRMVNQTGWNRTQDRSLHPSGEPLWQYLKASDSTLGLMFVFLPKRQTLELWPQPPPAGEVIAFKYASRYWTSLTGDLEISSFDPPPSGQHFVHFDPNLLVTALTLAYRRARGFDTTAAETEYQAALSAVQNANAVASPVLHVTRCPRHGEKLLDEWNMPDTGYGVP